jgi:phenylacetate-CoA ligase
VEIIDDEIVVTPLYRRLMPIIRYRTGDRGKWVEPSCDCGGGLPLFKLQGRIDSVILIWGCRIIHDHIILPLIDRGLDTATLQIEARLDSDKEILTVRFEKDSITSMADALKTDLRNDVYTLSTDVANTLSRPFLDTHLFFEPVQPGTLKRNERTGKVVPFLDLRASA